MTTVQALSGYLIIITYVLVLLSRFGLVLLAIVALVGWLREWSKRKLYLWLAASWLVILLATRAIQAILENADVQTRFPNWDTSGWFKFWLVFALLALLAIGYGEGLAWLKGRGGQGKTVAAQRGPFSPSELQRYARHITLREIGGPGQKRLKEARVLVIGAGGLGAPLLMYLATSGVGVLGVIDDDIVELPNLQRQIIHATDRIGMPKVQSALIALRALNPHVEIRPYNRRLTTDIIDELLADYDLVLDGSDNFDTRYLVNAACVRAGKPLIAAAISQWEGQLSLYHPAADGPCYQCVFPERPAPGMVPTCAEAGVAAPLPGVMGSLMALEAVKHLTGAGQTLRGRLMIFDGLENESRVIRAQKRKDCPVCGAEHGA